jgi:hypothetical protein
VVSELSEGCILSPSVVVVVVVVVVLVLPGGGLGAQGGRYYPMTLCIHVFVVHTPSTLTCDRNEHML